MSVDAEDVEPIAEGGLTTAEALGLLNEDPVNGSVGFAYHVLLQLLASLSRGGGQVFITVGQLLTSCEEYALDVSFDEAEQRFYLGVMPAPPLDPHSEICAFGWTVEEADA